MKKIFLSVSTAAALLAGNAWADVPVSTTTTPVAPDFSARVISISEDGLVNFENYGARRLWGVIPNVGYLKEILIGKDLLCYEVGEVFFSETQISILVADCDGQGIYPIGSGVLARHLIESGKGEEICPETRNAFGTCRLK